MRQVGTGAVAATRARRVKLADLTSGVGALVLGVGIGALTAVRIGKLAGALVLAGALLHGWGMLDKRRLETAGAAPRVWWANVLYWVCWGALAVLAIYLLVGRRLP